MTRPTLAPRKFSKADARRLVVALAAMAVVGACYWFILPAVQSRLVPPAPGGTTGPWVVRPILAFRFGAMAVLTSVTVPVLLRPFYKAWHRQDVALGTRYDQHEGRPIERAKFMAKGAGLFVIYAIGLLFYLSSWETVGPDGIEQRFLWVERHHRFDDVHTLETIPDGERSDDLKQNGPWYQVEFRDGRRMTLSLDNEGATPEELSTITSFIAARSGRAWERRDDARPRRGA